MKTLKKMRFLLLVTVVLFALSSCNKKDSGPGNFGSGTVKAKIDGTSVTFKNVTATKGIGLISISAIDKDDNSLSFTMPADITEGTYNLSDENNEIVMIYDTKNSDNGSYFSVSGEMKITKHNKNSNKLQATFNFTGENFNSSAVNITDGNIDVKYEEAN